MKQYLDDHVYGGLESALICPGCKCDNLHQYRVDVFFREKEDSQKGYAVTISDKGVITNSEMKDNPSQRRDGMFVRFYCEQCDVISQLEIVQHKGTTYLKLEPTEFRRMTDV